MSNASLAAAHAGAHLSLSTMEVTMRDDFLTRDWADSHQHMANGIDRLLSAMRALPSRTGRPPAPAAPRPGAR